LKAAIQAGRLRAVVLDVWEGEPSIDTSLLQMVDLGTPHIAGYSYDGKIAGMIMIYKSLCEHFRLQPRFDVRDFLPVPEVPRVEMDAGDAADEELLGQVVEKVYRITRDGRNLREVVHCAPEDRGRFFDALRKNYPVRREFHNTTVVLGSGREALRRKLRGIGFQMEGA
jgi:erythronate-4-phosphate dehydrogenase